MTPHARTRLTSVCLVMAGAALAGCRLREDAKSSADCLKLLEEGFRPIAAGRGQRFLGKVEEVTAGCRGGDMAIVRSKGRDAAGETRRGVDGALLDLEYQRIELIKFNLFDNSTYEQYVKGRGGLAGPSLKVWPEMRLPKDHPNYREAGGDREQLCQGDLMRYRTLTGICNDLRNPAMGSTNQLFGRLAEFESKFPDLGKNELARNRHAGRLALLRPDPQLISRKLFTRTQAHPDNCHAGLGLDAESKDADCDYKKADTFNVLAAFWIQFMTHDWFSHLEEGHNQSQTIATGCQSMLAGGVARPLTREDVARLGCRPEDRMDKAYIADDRDPHTFEDSGKIYLSRAYKTTRNTVTAWWDASQLYGYDAISRRRVKRDPKNPAKFLLVPGPRGGAPGYLPLLGPSDPMNPAWAGQESTAFPDNWNIGLSFFHHVFAREHNAFSSRRPRARRTLIAACGTRRGRIKSSSTKMSLPTSFSKWLVWWWPPRSPRSTPSNGLRSFSTTSRSTLP